MDESNPTPGTPTGDVTPTPPANPPASNDDGARTVPYDRFKAVNDAKRALETQLAELTGKAKTAEDLQAQVSALNATIARQNAAAAAGLPADLMPYIQGATAEEMATSAKFLADRLANGAAPNINADDKGDSKPTFTLAQISDHGFYTKHRDEILLAQREGRIRG